MTQAHQPQGPRLELKQTQSLVMTPQLRQAISLLQMNNLELDAHMRGELESNPFLEVDDGRPKNDHNDLTNTDVAPDEANRPDVVKKDDKLDADYSNVWTGDDAKVESRSTHDTMPSMAGVGAGGSSSFDGGDFSWENKLSEDPSLHDHISEQIQLEFTAPQDRMIAIALMDGLDETGYLSADILTIAKNLGADIEDVEHVLKRCQRFDPSGVFAVNLSQCMEIQLKERDLFTPKMDALLANLDLIGRGDFEKLMKKCDVTNDELRAMLSDIRSLDPKPGLQFTHVVSQTLVPDVLMRKNTDADSGESWIIELNPETLPKVLVNNSYFAEVKANTLKSDEKKYMTERINAANWLIKAMDQRAHTILKVAGEIIRQQESFFAYGVQYLKPLVLRDIADIIDMHESTVSRVTTNKYIETPRGTFELKYFFSSGLGSSDGGMDHSSQSVKSMIKDLIDAEGKAILSDESIAARLRDDGVDIARRTVAKYREAIGIGSSSDRRRAAKAAKHIG